MPSFSTTSGLKLATCDPRLQQICDKVIQSYDFTILEGYRSGERQDELFRQGKSKLQAGQSKHNSDPSLAVDIAPYPIDWEDTRRFYFLLGHIKQAALDLGIPVRLGADWNGNNEFKDQNFHDLPHVELL